MAKAKKSGNRGEKPKARVSARVTIPFGPKNVKRKSPTVSVGVKGHAPTGVKKTRFNAGAKYTFNIKTGKGKLKTSKRILWLTFWFTEIPILYTSQLKF